MSGKILASTGLPDRPQMEVCLYTKIMGHDQTTFLPDINVLIFSLLINKSSLFILELDIKDKQEI